MESAVASLHSFSGKAGQVSFELGMSEGKVGLYARTSQSALTLVESQIYAQYPDTDIEHLMHDPFQPGEDEEVVSVELSLGGPELFPIKRHPQFDDMLTRANMDPLAALTSSLGRSPHPDVRGHVQMIVRPLGGNYRNRAMRFLPLLQKGLPSMFSWYASLFARAQLARGWRRLFYAPIAFLMGGFRAWPLFGKFLTPPFSADKPSSDPDDAEVSSRNHDREDAVGGAYDKVNRLLYVCSIRVNVIAPKDQRAVAMRKALEIAGSYQQFTLPQSNAFAYGKPRIVDHVSADFSSHPFVMSSEEVATLWHIPTILVQTPNLDRILSKKLEPPVNLPVPSDSNAENLTVLGEALFQGRRMRFGIKPDDRRRHAYVIGKTGMGKSTLLENMIYSDVLSGKGVGVIDPHGDLIEAILRFIPKNRTNDVVLFDPSDREYPLSFNILEAGDPDQRPLVASGLMSVFTKLWPDAFSGRMEHILRNTLLTLLDSEGSTMLGILRIFGDEAYRKKVVSKISDPMVKSFWESEYDSWSEKYRTEAIAAIQNKIGQLLSTPLIRNIVGQVRSTLDVREAMDSGKIVLVNLSKGKLGEDTSAFLGSMLVTKFQIDAMSRADIPEAQRRDFYLYVDEFQNFATPSFASILSEARKYRLNLTMAHQYIGQLQLKGDTPMALRDAVFGNVGTICSFQVGSDDAEVLSLQFEEAATPKDILSLPKYHGYFRLMIDGVPSKPFSVDTLPPPQGDGDEHRADTIRKLSRERYAEKRAVVEEKILRWAASTMEAHAAGKLAEKQKEKEEEERKKARAKKMTLEQYRAWRDREMALNEFNALRKKEVMEGLSSDEKAKMSGLEVSLQGTGGVPPPSKAILEAMEIKKRKEERGEGGQ